MAEDIRHSAIAVTMKVFETMFFISLTPQGREPKEDSSSFDAPASFLRGEIEFRGKWSGKLRAYLPV